MPGSHFSKDSKGNDQVTPLSRYILDTRGQEEKKVVKVQLTITLLCVTYRATHGSAKEARRVAKRTGNDQRLELIIDLRQPGKRVEKK